MKIRNLKIRNLSVATMLAVALAFGGAPALAAPPETAPSAAPDDGMDGAAQVSGDEVDPLATVTSPDAVPEPAAQETTVPSAPVTQNATNTSDPAEADAGAAEETAEPTASPEAEDDGFVPVGEGHALPGPDTPLITAPDGSIQSAVESLETHAPANSRSALASPRAVTRAGNIKVTLVTATLADNRSGVNAQAARNAVADASTYWKSVSNNRISMTVAQTRTHASAARSSDDFSVMMNTISREIGWRDSPYTALVVVVPAGNLFSGGYGGILGGGWSANNTGGRILLPAPSNFTQNVTTHEFGHLLGLMHSNSLQCTNGRADVGINASVRWADSSCSSREYGDTVDLMGTSQFRLPVINSMFWDLGGFGRGDEVRNGGTAGASRTYTLTAWAGSGSNRAVKFKDPVSDEVYYLELRLPVGNDATAAVNGNRGVKIVKRDLVSWGTASVVIPPSTKPFAGYYNANHAWQAGQTFTTHGGSRVSVNWISNTEASVTVSGGAIVQATAAIDAVYRANPGLGAPTSAVTGGLRDGGAYRNYANGAILWSPATGAKASPAGAIRTAYQKSGFETGALGYPTSGQICGIKNGGCYQDFQGGAILWTKATGAQLSPAGPIRTAYQKSGFETGALGYPTSGQICGAKDGGCYQNYQGGTLYHSPATGAQATTGGDIQNAYRKSGAEKGALGYPTGEKVCGIKGGGCYQNFQKGAILWSPSTGAQLSISGPIRSAYQKSGFESGRLGYPTGPQRAAGTGTTQDYQGGKITATAGGQATVTYK